MFNHNININTTSTRCITYNFLMFSQTDKTKIILFNSYRIKMSIIIIVDNFFFFGVVSFSNVYINNISMLRGFDVLQYAWPIS